MPSYSELDSDETRLPEGFTRTGYDADTETYTYTSADGSSYSGLPGNRYGRLYQSGSPAYQEALVTGDPWAREIHKRGWRFSEDMRYLSSFLLIVGVCLIMLLWWTGRGDGVPWQCAIGQKSKIVEQGDTCWKIAQEYGVDVKDLTGPYKEGPTHAHRLDLDCDNLGIGSMVCISEKI